MSQHDVSVSHRVCQVLSQPRVWIKREEEGGRRMSAFRERGSESEAEAKAEGWRGDEGREEG